MNRYSYLKSVLLLGCACFAVLNVKASTNPGGNRGELERVSAQEDKQTVSGVIQDENGEPLIGVSVSIRQTVVGTISDIDGHYRIEAAPGDVLVFSYTGFKSAEYKVSEQTTFNLVMAVDQQLLDEVVVTGYQTLSRERATGSFDRVGQELLAARPSSDISSALQGLIPGLTATESLDGSVNFVIRGASTLYADKQPLIVVDGFPIQGTFNSINPNDVESVTVLKDAAAASIWGARSANGVIVITTKKGSKDRLKVNVNSFYRFAAPPDLDHTLALADSRTQVDYELDALKNHWMIGSEYTPSFANIWKGLTLAQELYYAHKYFGLSEAEMNAGLDRLRNTSNHGQIKDHILRRQAVQQHNISLSGGNERMSNYLSLMYEKRDENTIRRGYDRYMANFNNSYRFSPAVTAHFSAEFQRKDIDHSGTSLGDLANLSPYELLLNPDGSYAPNILDFNRHEQAQLPLNKFPYDDWSYNLLREAKGREYRTEALNYRIQAGLNIQVLKGLSYDTRIQYETSKSEEKKYDGEETYAVRNLANSMTEYNADTQTVGRSSVPKGGIEKRRAVRYENYVVRNQLNYGINLQAVHDLSAVAGFEISQYTYDQTIYAHIYGYNKERNTTAIPPYGFGNSRDPLTDFMGETESIPGGNTRFSSQVDRYLSYYGNLGYTYDNRYSASFSIRTDGSNFVSKDPALRWAPMWSVGGKWNARQEAFTKGLTWLNRFDLRLTYGINGNAEKSTSPLTLISMGNSISGITNTPIANISSRGNPKLKWEKTYTTNLGVDFGVFKFLSGKLEYYHRNSKDVIGMITIPTAHGSQVQRMNNAEIRNRGVELELTAKGTIPQYKLDISSTLIYAYNENKITRLYNSSLYAYELVAPTTFVEGRPVGSIHSYRYAGTIDGVPYVYGVNGEKTSMNDLSLHNRTLGLSVLNYSGTMIPPHTFGWVNRFTYRDFTLHVFLTGNFGGVFRAPTLGSVPSAGGNKMQLSKYIKDFYESDGSSRPALPRPGETGFYRWGRYTPNLEYYVEDASFIRLKEVSLEYLFPKRFSQKFRMSEARLFTQARDLGLLYTANRYGYDPEWLPGYEKPGTTITVGIHLDF